MLPSKTINNNTNDDSDDLKCYLKIEKNTRVILTTLKSRFFPITQQILKWAIFISNSHMFPDVRRKFRIFTNLRSNVFLFGLEHSPLSGPFYPNFKMCPPEKGTEKGTGLSWLRDARMNQKTSNMIKTQM